MGYTDVRTDLFLSYVLKVMVYDMEQHLLEQHFYTKDNIVYSYLKVTDVALSEVGEKNEDKTKKS